MTFTTISLFKTTSSRVNKAHNALHITLMIMKGMEFAYYETKTLTDFENELKTLALNKYQFSKEVEVLKEEEILEKSNSHEREILKVFKDNAQITTYHFKSHKSNYLIIIVETKTPNIIGLTVIFDKKPFKQIGKVALGSLIGLTAMSGGSLLIAAVGLGIIGSYFKRTFTIKGPLGKEITKFIERHFGEPVKILK